MSVYNLDIQSQNRYYNSAQEKIKEEFKKYYFNKNFKVGEGIKDFDEVKYAITMSNILCTDNCEIINYVQDKLDGLLENCGIKKKNRNFFETIQLTEQNCCNQSTPLPIVVDAQMKWSEVTW